MSNILNQYCRKIELLSDTSIDSNESRALHVEVWEIPTHRWRVKYTSNPINGTAAQRQMFVFFNSLKNGAVPFSWSIPIHNEPAGLANSNPLVLQATAAGSETVKLNATLPTDFLLPGDMVKFSNHDKVYYCMNTVEGVNPTIQLNCALKKPVDHTTTLITRNVAIKFVLNPKQSTPGLARSIGSFSEPFTAEFIEKL